MPGAFLQSCCTSKKCFRCVFPSGIEKYGSVQSGRRLVGMGLCYRSCWVRKGMAVGILGNSRAPHGLRTGLEGSGPRAAPLCARCCFQACLALVPRGFPAQFLVFVHLQHFICSFMFKVTSPHADSFLLVSFLLLFLFP